tara:strand:+ start:351 stop:605 length:255 start_codon:yes stop_codon:yes gene_type:complete
MRATLKKINERAKPLGFGLAKTYEGGPYFYWHNLQDENGEWLGGDLKETIVCCVVRLADMTLEEWIEDLEDKIAEAQADEFHQY